MEFLRVVSAKFSRLPINTTHRFPIESSLVLVDSSLVTSEVFGDNSRTRRPPRNVVKG